MTDQNEEVEEHDVISTAWAGSSAAGGEFAAEQTLRVEETVHITWTGVTNCCDSQRVHDEVNARFNSWLGTKVNEHAPKVPRNWGWGDSTVNCSSSREPWPSNARSCRASTASPFFVEFSEG